MCISQSLLNVNNYGMPLRIYFRLSYISVACNALFTYGILVRFCPWLSLKSYLENHLIKAIPIIALHDYLSSWNVNIMLSKHCVYF